MSESEDGGDDANDEDYMPDDDDPSQRVKAESGAAAKASRSRAKGRTRGGRRGQQSTLCSCAPVTVRMPMLFSALGISVLGVDQPAGAETASNSAAASSASSLKMRLCEADGCLQVASKLSLSHSPWAALLVRSVCVCVCGVCVTAC